MSATHRNLPGRERQDHDQYMTPPWTVEALQGAAPLTGPVLDPCCGDGGLLRALRGPLERHGMDIDGELIQRARNDIWWRGAGWSRAAGLLSQQDFLGEAAARRLRAAGIRTIVTNPPYKLAEKFVARSLRLLPHGGEVFMLLRLGFLASQRRRALYQRHFRGLYVLTRRPSFRHGRTDSTDYAWFHWQTGFEGDAVVRRLEVER